MHQLFSQVLGQRDLSRAGDLFSLGDAEIEGCLSQALDQIKVISCSQVSMMSLHGCVSIIYCCCSTHHSRNNLLKLPLLIAELPLVMCWLYAISEHAEVHTYARRHAQIYSANLCLAAQFTRHSINMFGGSTCA